MSKVGYNWWCYEAPTPFNSFERADIEDNGWIIVKVMQYKSKWHYYMKRVKEI